MNERYLRPRLSQEVTKLILAFLAAVLAYGPVSVPKAEANQSAAPLLTELLQQNQEIRFGVRTQSGIVNVRPDASTSGNPIGTIAPGEVVLIISGGGSDWFQVAGFDDDRVQETGFVRGDLLQEITAEDLAEELDPVAAEAFFDDHDLEIRPNATSFLQENKEYLPLIVAGVFDAENLFGELPERLKIQVVYDASLQFAAEYNNGVIRLNLAHPSASLGSIKKIMVHEAVHSVQAEDENSVYPQRGPLWLTEGFAEWLALWYYQQPIPRVRIPNQDSLVDQSTSPLTGTGYGQAVTAVDVLLSQTDSDPVDAMRAYYQALANEASPDDAFQEVFKLSMYEFGQTVVAETANLAGETADTPQTAGEFEERLAELVGYTVEEVRNLVVSVSSGLGGEGESYVATRNFSDQFGGFVFDSTGQIIACTQAAGLTTSRRYQTEVRAVLAASCMTDSGRAEVFVFEAQLQPTAGQAEVTEVAGSVWEGQVAASSEVLTQPFVMAMNLNGAPSTAILGSDTTWIMFGAERTVSQGINETQVVEYMLFNPDDGWPTEFVAAGLLPVDSLDRSILQSLDQDEVQAETEDEPIGASLEDVTQQVVSPGAEAPEEVRIFG